MSEKRVQRRLAAILAADVVGYSRLMEQDETGTLSRLRVLRSEIFDPRTRQFDGRIFKNTGDGALAEFGSAVDAVKCAVEIQRRLAEQSAVMPEGKSITLRIGISLGDVIVDGEDLFGNGVNVAARMETLAEPGGICISGNVHEHLRVDTELAFEDLGEQSVKNIDRPIRVWKWLPKGATAARELPSWRTAPSSSSHSIAVLPFTNMSGDPEQEYFADGITEDIITTLSKLPNLLVVARNSTFSYKGRSVDVKQVGVEQGVRCVLEGSTRRAGDRIRVTAQLVDAVSGHQMWSDRFDRLVDDIFALQDEIALKIVTELQVELLEGEMARITGSGTASVEAWSEQVRAVACTRVLTKESYAQARKWAERAAATDAQYASPLATIAFIHAIDARLGWTESQIEAISLAKAFASRALDLDADNPEAHGTLGIVNLVEGRHEEAIGRLKTALNLNPNHADLTAYLGIAHNWIAEPNVAINLIQKAMRLCPIYPAWYQGCYGHALRIAKRYDEAIAAFREYGKRQPGSGHIDLAIIFTELARIEEARHEAEEILKHRPEFSIGKWVKTQMYRDPNLLDHDVAALRKAGLPE